MLIQNAPGETEWPVRRRNRYRRMVELFRRGRNPTRAALRSTALIGPGFAIVMILLFTQAAWTKAMPPSLDSIDEAIVPLLVITLLIIIVPSVIASIIDAGLPLREQRRYAAGSPELTERQQQILAIDATSDYAIRGWNSSLEYWPAGVRLRPPLLDPRARSPFLTMALLDVSGVRNDLDRRFRVVNAQTLQLFVADAMSDRSYSASLLRVLSGPDAEVATARIAALSGTDEWDLRARTEPRGARPPVLLWALDAQRIIAAVRMSFVAGYIDESHAWELLEQVADIAFSLHSDWNELHQALIVGTAFMADSLEEVERVRTAVQGLADDGWPAATIPFGTGSGRLPEQVLSPSVRFGAQPPDQD